MIRRGGLLLLCAGVAGLFAAGCSGAPEGASVTLSEAEGVVMFKGSPFAGATVTFMPEKGPVAMGTTDLEGKFKLSTGAQPGVAVGKCKVTVSAVEAGKSADTTAPAGASMTKPANEEEMKKRLQSMDPSAKMATVRESGLPTAKSLINPKFANPDTSGLTATVDKDSTKNKFSFEVTE
jgi:hypothetical protein